ncbi:MAG: PAS domain-containing protein [Bacteroidales bacterium]
MTTDELDFTNAEMLRKKAEELLKEKQKKIDKKINEADNKKLVHELQVYQIELEMQNEELRQAYETSEQALKKYTMLYDFSPIGYFTIDRDGVINDLNFSGAEMLQEKRFSLIDTNFKLFIHENSKSIFNDFLNKVYSSNRKESCEVMLGYDNNSLCYAYIEGIITFEEQKCLLSVVNISGLKK